MTSDDTMARAAARASSAWKDLAEALEGFTALGPGRRTDVADLVTDWRARVDRSAPIGGTTEAKTDYLDQLAAAIAADGCPVAWSVYPEHGNTLASTGGRTRCTAPGCDRAWDWDRLDAACGRRTTHSLITPKDSEAHRMCAVHAADAQDRVTDAMLLPITP